MNSRFEELIRARREEALIRRDTLSLVLRVILVAAAAYILFGTVFLITQVKGNEMFPALKDGDLAITFRLQREYTKNDIVVFEEGGTRRFARVIALEGDNVTLDDSGVLNVNGTNQSGEIFYPTYAGEGQEYPFVVPEDSMYVLCDRRTDAEDSRDFGPVSLDRVDGKVITILRRRGL